MALNFLSDVGHLRLIKEHLQLTDNTFRWVTHPKPTHGELTRAYSASRPTEPSPS